MSLTPATNKQVPDHAILDHFDKQVYLGNQFAYSTGNVTPGVTTEYSLILISDPAVSASAFPSGWISIFQNYRAFSCLTSGQSAIFRVYLNPTATTGTAKTPINLRPNNKATSISATSLIPTASNNGTLIGTFSVSGLATIISNQLSIIDPSNSLLITAQPSSNTTVVSCDLAWYEL